MSRSSRLLTVLVTGIGLVAIGIGIGTWGTRAVLTSTTSPTAVSADAAPATASASPLVPRGDGWVAWAARGDGSPMRWDPCTPIEWTVRQGDPAWLADVAGRALDEVGRAAGVEFRYVQDDRVAIGSAATTGDGAGWAPVVVTFTTPDEVDWLTDDDRALAVPVVVDDTFVTGQVLLNETVNLSSDFSSRDASWGATLLHEAAHLVGLDHVDDPTQLLHAYPRPGPAALSAGDLRGLTALRGDRACLPVEPIDVAVPAPHRRGTGG